MGLKRRKQPIDLRKDKGEKPFKKFLFVASVVFGCAIVCGGLSMLIYQGLSRSVFFQVDKVDIIGCNKLDTRQVLSWSGLDIKTNLWSLRTSKLKKHLEKHSWIESAIVKRKWPNALRIKIRERVPVALINKKSGLYYIDKKGVVISSVLPTDGLDYPIITGKEEATGPDALPNAKWLQDTLSFIRYAGSGNPVLPKQNISEIHVGPEGQLTLYLADNPFPIYLGQGEMKKKYGRLSKVLSWLYRKKEFTSTESINLNYLADLKDNDNGPSNRVLVSFTE
jgi:cell division protein FtsQ